MVKTHYMLSYDKVCCGGNSSHWFKNARWEESGQLRQDQSAWPAAISTLCLMSWAHVAAFWQTDCTLRAACSTPHWAPSPGKSRTAGKKRSPISSFLNLLNLSLVEFLGVFLDIRMPSYLYHLGRSQDAAEIILQFSIVSNSTERHPRSITIASSPYNDCPLRHPLSIQIISRTSAKYHLSF